MWRKLGVVVAKSIAKKNFANNLARQFLKLFPSSKIKVSQAAKQIFILSLISIIFSCAQGKFDPFERTTGITRSDVEKAMLKNQKEDRLKKLERAQDEAPIPSVSKLIISPPPPAIGGDKIISFSVTDQVPLKDVLIELGRVAGIDVDLDPSISGGVIISAKNRPLKEVIDRIATLGNLRYSYKNRVLHFERDSPYMKNYFVDYITDGTLWSDVESNITAVLDAHSDFSGDTDSSFTSNKSAGIMSVFATQKQHDAVLKYLADVERYASAQVLIEAKVVEVKLSDTYKTGIDWSWTDTDNKGATTTISNATSPSFDSTVNTKAALTGAFGTGSVKKVLFGGSIDATITALEEFGTTKTLSSPRIHAMNNQKATLNFVDKLVYFHVESTQTQAPGQSGNVASTTTATKQEENVGVELSITPSINLKTSEVTMTIVPIVSVKSGEVTDPANSANKVPIIQTRELNTIAKIQSGNIIVIGGLMKEEATNVDSGIPFLNKIPVFGWLFKSVSKVSTVTETVIFIKATIVNSATPVGKIDREMQQKFDPNQRRFF